jgi:hypothetical protein
VLTSSCTGDWEQTWGEESDERPCSGIVAAQGGPLRAAACKGRKVLWAGEDGWAPAYRVSVFKHSVPEDQAGDVRAGGVCRAFKAAAA